MVRDTGGNIPLVVQDGTLLISACVGDFDGDGDVDILDVQNSAYRWNTRCGDANYSPAHDLDHDCDIDILASSSPWPTAPPSWRRLPRPWAIFPKASAETPHPSAPTLTTQPGRSRSGPSAWGPRPPGRMAMACWPSSPSAPWRLQGTRLLRATVFLDSPVHGALSARKYASGLLPRNDRPDRRRTRDAGRETVVVVRRASRREG